MSQPLDDVLPSLLSVLHIPPAGKDAARILPRHADVLAVSSRATDKTTLYP